jgi:phage-related protein
LIAPAVASAVIAFAPFLAIGMAVAGLAFIIIKYWEPIKAFFVNTFGGLFTAFSDFFMGIWTLVQPIVMEIVNFLMTKFQTFKTFWDEHWGMIKQAFVNIWTFISGFISGALKVIFAIFKFVFPAIKFLVMSIFETIKGLISGALTFIMGVIQVFAGLFTGNWSKMWEGIKNMFFGAIQFIWNYIQLFFGAKILGVLGKFAGKGLSWIKGFASKAGSAISKFAGKVWNYIKTMASNVVSTIKTGVSMWIRSIDDFVYKILRKITSFNTDLGLLFTRGWEALKGIVKKGVGMIIDAVTGFGKTFLKAGKGLLEAFTDGIKKGIGKAKDAVESGMSAIRDFLPFSPAKKGALSDLDKSGESFFPTWYEGALKKVNPMTRAIGGAMSKMNSELQGKAGNVQLEAFGSSGRTTVRQVIEVRGQVDVKGDNGNETVQVAGQIEEELVTIRDLRQAIRKR